MSGPVSFGFRWFCGRVWLSCLDRKIQPLTAVFGRRVSQFSKTAQRLILTPVEVSVYRVCIALLFSGEAQTKLFDAQ